MRLTAAYAVVLLLAAPASANSTVLRSHAWVWPASGTITTPFGYSHAGIDIGMLRSLDVRAATPGVVAATGYVPGFEGYGNIVLVNAGSGVQVLYAHLAVVQAKIGRRVVPGRLLGIAGCTGSCTGTHLHFELRVRGTAVDPLRFLPAGVPDAPAGPRLARRIEIAHAARSLLARMPDTRLSHWLASHSRAGARRHRLARRLALVRRPFP